MKDVLLFNHKYLTLLRTFVMTDCSLKEEPSLIAEIRKSSAATTDCLAKSPILIVEPKITVHDLKRSAVKDLPVAIVKLNYSYLTLLKMLVRENIRQAMLISKCSHQVCEMIANLTEEDIKEIANSNYQMCVCEIKYLHIRRAITSDREIDPRSFRSNYLQHIPLFQSRQV